MIMNETIKSKDNETNKVYEISIDILVDNELTPNQIVLLNIIHDKDEVAYIKYIDIDREAILKHDLYTLYRKDFLVNEQNTRYVFKFSELYLTDKGTKFITGKSEVKGKKQIAFDEFMDKYYEMFPNKIYAGTLPVKSQLKTCKSKMLTFIREYKYDYETILKATEMYVKLCKAQGYGYMKTCYYFIKKDNESVLQSYCEQVLDSSNVNTNKDEFSRDLQ